MKTKFDIDQTTLDGFCRRWKITTLELFGSALRDDFGPQSDLDFLVTFANESTWTLLDHVKMQAELATLLGRSVDLVSRNAIERSRNSVRRTAILSSAEPVYAR